MSYIGGFTHTQFISQYRFLPNAKSVTGLPRRARVGDRPQAGWPLGFDFQDRALGGLPLSSGEPGHTAPSR